MRIIVINLARATERRRLMEGQAATLGLALTFLEATDGSALTVADRAPVDDEARRRITPYPLSDGEIGCWISHLRAMDMLLQSGDVMAAILEDDAVLAPDFPRVLKTIEAQSTPFDVIDLHRNFRKGEIFAHCRELLPGFALGRVGYTHMNATAYVVSREGAKKFRAHAKCYAHAVDKELHRYWVNGLDIYGLENPVAAQTKGGYSYIDETRAQDRPKERPCYANASTPYWRFMRWRTKAIDSIRKRLAFPSYVRKGRSAA
jgi:glycosyl transferase family 25